MFILDISNSALSILVLKGQAVVIFWVPASSVILWDRAMGEKQSCCFLWLKHWTSVRMTQSGEVILTNCQCFNHKTAWLLSLHSTIPKNLVTRFWCISLATWDIGWEMGPWGTIYTSQQCFNLESPGFQIPDGPLQIQSQKTPSLSLPPTSSFTLILGFYTCLNLIQWNFHFLKLWHTLLWRVSSSNYSSLFLISWKTGVRTHLPDLFCLKQYGFCSQENVSADWAELSIAGGSTQQSLFALCTGSEDGSKQTTAKPPVPFFSYMSRKCQLELWTWY